MRRGHDISWARPPELIGFVESSEIAAASPAPHTSIEPYVNYWTLYQPNYRKNQQQPVKLRLESQQVGSKPVA